MNIKQIQEEINKKAQMLKLTAQEKNAMLEHVFNSPVVTPHYSPYTILIHRFKFISKSSMYAFVLLFIFFVSSGGILAYSSLNALPGESLYAIKVKVVEPLVDSFTFSNISHAKLEADKAIRRLDEAEKLLSQNNLTSEHRKEIENRFKKNADDFAVVMESIQKNSSDKKDDKDDKKDKEKRDELDDLKMNFEKSVNVRVENLRRNSEKIENKNQRREVESLESAVRERTSFNSERLNSDNDKEDEDDNEEDQEGKQDEDRRDDDSRFIPLE